MSNDVRSVLAQFRNVARSEREKGTYFERLAVAFLKNDPGMAQEYEDAWPFADWAKAHGVDGRDTGIDAVAKLRNQEGFCAIQCKFYREGYRIQKADLDSFFTASGKQQFTRRLIIDTTDTSWGENAESALVGQQIATTRIGLDRLEQSLIDWSAFLLRDTLVIAPKKEPRPHQIEAIDCVRKGFAEHDRGKMIMACGTGKTFTALKISEALVGAGGSVLYLVPSLSLMSQSVREWTIDGKTPLRAFAVCSDTQVGKRRVSNDDAAEIEAHDLDYPATTNAKKLAREAARSAPERMTVVFATYQSIQTVADAQTQHGLREFDLIVCDEAHRTTGARFPGEEESNFIKVHDAAFIRAKKRLYMTATPRVFGDNARTKASEASVELCSMDDETLFGPTFFARGFGWAVQNRLLTDYKVIVLAVDEGMVSAGIQRRLADGTNELKLDDATKIVGCYKALTKAGLKEDVGSDSQPMYRALAFAKDIASSKLISAEFAAVVEDYLASDEGQQIEDNRTPLRCELDHVDGTFGAKRRTERLDWLKANSGESTCRILTNARCLSEGVDVPALDAILFLHPRKSQIDVVQSVGRVMRKAEGKRMGYVILPIGVPAGMTPEEALNDNERYRVVWQILNALRSHDERLDATINKMDLGADVSDHIEVIAVSNKLPTKAEPKKDRVNIGHGSAAGEDEDDHSGTSTSTPIGPVQGAFVFDEFARAIMAKIVKKCGRRDYWEDWADDIAKIAQTHVTRINAVVQKPGQERDAFTSFLAEIRDDLNESITESAAIEMLAQHIITKPVFEALFEGYSFSKNNPVSRAMQSVLDVLDEQNLGKEVASLQRFYNSVKARAMGIDNAAGKQRIIVELYDKFFRNAFPRMTEMLGIVYTPVEVVDFIIKSVNDVLHAEFDQTLGSTGVHIIDPFVGTGTFITRLMQSGLIKPDQLAEKYRHELHANEIVLLAYYIAAINIEAVYHTLTNGEYSPFEGICLTDTFQLYENHQDLISDLLADNNTRREHQKKLNIRVIIGNPPYSAGQKSANDDAGNLEYPTLDQRIAEKYVSRSSRSGGKRASYDSYIRALRWATDRVGDAGVIGFVSGSGFTEKPAMDGIRRCLADEFSSIYVLNLRGDIRKNMLSKGKAREGQNIFGGGSMTGISLTILVKNPKSAISGQVFYHDIGDDLSTEQKLAAISRFGSLEGVACAGAWRKIVPDEHGDWLRQRDGSLGEFLSIGSKKGDSSGLFRFSSNGVVSNRDAWVYNSSKATLASNCVKMIKFFNSEIDRSLEHESLTGNQIAAEVFVKKDETKISWGGNSWKAPFNKKLKESFTENAVRIALYRPFNPQWHYGSKTFNHSFYSMPKIFPDMHSENKVICVSGIGARSGFSALITDRLTNLHTLDTGQCFPRYVYEQVGAKAEAQGGLFVGAPDAASEARRVDAITDQGLMHFQAAYPDQKIDKDDLFYYVYGILHSQNYRDRFSDTLSKELPRIPAVNSTEDFWAFVEAGRQLASLHIGYETVVPYPVIIAQGDLRLANISDPESFYRVEQMRFAGKRPKQNKTSVIYNSNITMTDIPLEAYEYIVNGKPALEWVMERQCVKSDKASGIVNDANRYAIETMGDPAYPLKLFQRIITVSLETMKIVRDLPLLNLESSVPAKGESQAAE